ncbi:hypothetical protein OG462_41765 [Streptomyces sp. NBC_01077]|nr:hypothetical protein OG462_03255 [Streptomyces sp. NBC_01077]WSV43412.1 hypothetical protein OG462_41765 [Streptomyces sp. NBC_01077]
MDGARPGNRIAPIDESEIGVDTADTPSQPDVSGDSEEVEA